MTNEWPANSTTWEGVIVESGDVRVDITVAGIPATVTSRIEVSPRTTGKWSSDSPWANKISFVEGEGHQCGVRPAANFVRIDGAIGFFSSWGNSSCSIDPERRIQIDPTDDDGYDMKAINSGPNANLWYVDDASWFFKGTSQVNKGAFPDAQQDSMSLASQRGSCKGKGYGETTNFWEFNRRCRPQPDFQDFLAGVWDHEEEHYRNARRELLKSKNHLYVKAERYVRSTKAQLKNGVSTVYGNVQARMVNAARSEAIYGNWQGTIWLWKNISDNVFVQRDMSF